MGQQQQQQHQHQMWIRQQQMQMWHHHHLMMQQQMQHHQQMQQREQQRKNRKFKFNPAAAVFRPRQLTKGTQVTTVFGKGVVVKEPREEDDIVEVKVAWATLYMPTDKATIVINKSPKVPELKPGIKVKTAFGEGEVITTQRKSDGIAEVKLPWATLYIQAEKLVTIQPEKKVVVTDKDSKTNVGKGDEKDDDKKNEKEKESEESEGDEGDEG